MYSESYRTPEYIYNMQVRTGQRYRDLLISCSSLPTSGSVIDIGCGPGGVLKAFNNENLDCFGCDFDDEYMDYGRRLGLELRNGDLFDVYNKKKFNLVIMSHVLEHVSYPVEYLYDIHNMMEKNGVILIEVPGLKSLHLGCVERFFQGVHLNTFYGDYMKKLMECLGFDVLYCDEVLSIVCKKKRASLTINEIQEILRDFQYNYRENYNYIARTVYLYNYGLNIGIYKRIIRRFIVNTLDACGLKKYIKLLCNI